MFKENGIFLYCNKKYYLVYSVEKIYLNVKELNKKWQHVIIHHLDKFNLSGSIYMLMWIETIWKLLNFHSE